MLFRHYYAVLGSFDSEYSIKNVVLNLFTECFSYIECSVCATLWSGGLFEEDTGASCHISLQYIFTAHTLKSQLQIKEI